MTLHRRDAFWTFLAVAALVPLAGACGDGGSSEGEPAGEREMASGEAGGSSGGYTVDMDEIFPDEPGKDLVLNNCQNCHTWVPIVVLQMNEEEWARWAQDHRGRVEALSDEEFDTLYEYLVSNFNPDTPVPDLPPALLETWTSY